MEKRERTGVDFTAEDKFRFSNARYDNGAVLGMVVNYQIFPTFDIVAGLNEV